MIDNIEITVLENLWGNTEFSLPKRWEGKDFQKELNELFELYQQKVFITINDENTQKDIKIICDGLIETIQQYYLGLPHKAYNKFNEVMEKLMENPLKIYQKSGNSVFQFNDPLVLFRLRNVTNNISYKRKDIFHTPYSLRAKVSSCRYSIAGYPSLYLGTSLELCNKEINGRLKTKNTIASKFKVERNSVNNGHTDIKVIELAIKPQDFITNENNNQINQRIYGNHRLFDTNLLLDSDIKENYLLWYPLIASCSFIRANKNDAFSSEYIIPQLLMQWIRMCSKPKTLYGIRYFSCVSNYNSDLGFNYVFPVSGKCNKNNNDFCEVLSQSFKLSDPVFINDYGSIKSCEEYLRNIPDSELSFL